MSHEEDYAAVSRQIGELLAKAANDRSPGGMVGLGSTWLAAEMYIRNETYHLRIQEARTELVQAIQQRIAQKEQDQAFLELLMGCACVHPDAHECFVIRYNRDIDDFSGFDEECQCYCHSQWSEDEENEQS